MKPFLLLLLFGACWSTSHAQLIRYQENYKVGYKNASGNIVVPPRYDAGSDMAEGFAIVMRGELRGYIGSRGEEVIPCRYQDAAPFVHGLACVGQQGKWGFIRTSGEWAIQPLFDNAFSFRNGLARVLTHGKWGMINEQGQMIIPALYTRLYDLSDGLIAASLDEQKYGYLDAAGKVAIDFQYTLSLPFDESSHKGIVYRKDGPWYIDAKGRVLEKIHNPEEDEENHERHERRRRD